MAKQKKITMEEYRKNPQAEKKNVKGYRPYTGKKDRKTKSKEDAELIKLSKRANVRLKALEDKQMRTGAYRSAHKKQLQNVSYMYEVDGKPRFRQGVKVLNENQKKSMREFLEKFLQTESSKISGAKNIYKKSKESFEENLGHTLTYDEYSQIVESINQSTITKRYSSDEYIDVISYGMDNGMSVDDIMDVLKMYDSGTFNALEDVFDYMSKDNEGNKEDLENLEGWSSSNEWDNIF